MSDNPFKFPHNAKEVKELFDFERSQPATRRKCEKVNPNDGKRLTFRSSHLASKQSFPSTEANADLHSEFEKRIHSKHLVGKTQRISDLIEEKREMFLIQMAINTKREEIQNMEEGMRGKEDELKKREEILEDDAIRFDAFLKENNKKANDMIQLAEKESKIKNDIVQDIKRLNKQLQIVRTHKEKFKLDIEVCQRYKAFLDALTPNEWFDEQQKLKRTRQRERRRKRIKNRQEQWVKEFQKKIEDETHSTREVTHINHLRRTAKINRKGNQANNECDVEISFKSTMPSFEDEPLTSSDEELPIFFKEPRQLIDKYSSLEEDNLFLVLNKQEAEHNLENLQHELKESKLQLKRKSDEYDSSLVNLKINLEEEEEKLERIKSTKAKDALPVNEKEKELRILRDKIKEVFTRCGLGDPGSNPIAIVLLTNIETCLQDTFERIRRYPKDYVTNAEKMKGKLRREMKRAEQQALLVKAQEERNRKSIERSFQPPKKHIGKPVMFRSQIRKKETVKKCLKATEEQLEEIRHFT